MTTPRMMILMIMAIALVYVVLPVALDTFARFRGRRRVICPDTGTAAEIEIDAWHAAVTAFPGPPRLRVARCTGRVATATCGEECLTTMPQS